MQFLIKQEELETKEKLMKEIQRMGHLQNNQRYKNSQSPPLRNNLS